jgi:hypothetical protein
MKHIKDERGFWTDYDYEDIKKVWAKETEKRVKIIVTLSAIVYVPKRWIDICPDDGSIEFKNPDDNFYIGMKKDDICLDREIDFGLIDYILLDEPNYRLAEDD